MPRNVRLIVLATVLLLSASSSALAQTLAWDPNPEPDVTGYTVYVGTKSGQYSTQVDVGNQTTYPIDGIDWSLDYYFAVQAYTSTGLKSPLSAEVKLPAAAPPGTTVITSFRADSGYPLLVGKTVTWTANATSKLGAVEYQFWMYSPSSGWTLVQDYSANNTFTWTPGWNDISLHLFQVWARTVGSKAKYEAWVATDFFYVNAAPLQLSSDTDFPTPPGNVVTWNAAVAGAGDTAFEYKFWVLDQGTATWSVLRAWGASNEAAWTPPATGKYTVQAWARRVGSSVNYDVWNGTGTLTVSKSQLNITSFTADASFPAPTGTPITWTVRSKGGSSGPIQYEFWRYTAAAGWKIVQPYSTSATYTWTPAWGDEGRFAVQVWARSATSTANYEAWQGSPFLGIVRAPVHLSTATLFPAAPGTPVTWTASVDDQSVSFEYKFWLYDRSVGTWSSPPGYTSANTFLWTPTATGKYAVQVWVRKVGSTAFYDAWTGTGYLDVAQGPVVVKSLTADTVFPVAVGKTINWTALAFGGSQGPLQYKFWTYSAATGWVVAQNWSSSNTLAWTPTVAGNYALQVWVKSSGSTAQYEGWIGSPFVTITP